MLMRDSSPQAGNIEVTVKDFGPIVEARVDLRPFTVFVGPSNTGKSFLAVLTYALHRHFGRSGRGYYPRTVVRRVNDIDLATFLEFVRDILVDTGRKSAVLPESMVDGLRRGLDDTAASLALEIQRCFGAGAPTELVRRGRKSATVHIHHRVTGSVEPISQVLTLADEEQTLKTTIPEELTVSLGDHERERAYYFLRVAELEPPNPLVRMRIWQFLAEQVLGSLLRSAHYLPADRTGVMHAHQFVVGALINSASMAGLRPTSSAATLSGVLADFIERLISIAPDHGSVTARGFGTTIEKSIMNGSIKLDSKEASDYPHFAFRPGGWKSDLPLARASSMISELAPVVLYLRHIVMRDDLLIVEEPESHLHPAMQVEFTRQLAKLVNAGVRVLVTTHSEWLLEALANIVQRPGRNAGEEEKSEPVSLEAPQVGIWLFQPSNDGATVKEIRPDESGLYPSGFDDVAVELHNDWAAIRSEEPIEP